MIVDRMVLSRLESYEGWFREQTLDPESHVGKQEADLCRDAAGEIRLLRVILRKARLFINDGPGAALAVRALAAEIDAALDPAAMSGPKAQATSELELAREFARSHGHLVAPAEEWGELHAENARYRRALQGIASMPGDAADGDASKIARTALQGPGSPVPADPDPAVGGSDA